MNLVKTFNKESFVIPVFGFSNISILLEKQSISSTYITIIKSLITMREIFTEKYRTEVFVYRPSPYGEVCTKKQRSDISQLPEKAKLLKGLLYGIILPETKLSFFLVLAVLYGLLYISSFCQ